MLWRMLGVQPNGNYSISRRQLLMSCLQNELILESLYEQVLEDPELSEPIRLTEELFEV